MKKSKDTKGLGIKFGRSRPDKTKYVIVDVTYDDATGKKLFDVGMELISKDKEAVIGYAVNAALKNTINLKKK
jgi:hypothetical protein